MLEEEKGKGSRGVMIGGRESINRAGLDEDDVDNGFGF